MTTQPSHDRPRRILETRPLSEEELQQERDWKWVLSDRERLQKYAGQIVAVCRETIWAVGRDHLTVLANATAALEKAAAVPGVPSVDDLSFVVVPEWQCDEGAVPALQR
jgi:hypothetical protein